MAEIKNLLIAIILFSAVLLGVGGFYANLSTNYGTSTTDIRSLSALNQTQEQINQIKGSIDRSEPNILSLVDILATGVFSTLKLMLAIPNIFSGIITDVAGILGLPGWVFGVFMALVTIYVVYAIIKAITKVDV